DAALRARAQRPSPEVIAVAPRTVAPSQPPPPSAAETPAQPAPEGAAEIAAAVEEGQRASERGDHAGAALAFGRAYALRPDAQLALQLSAAEEAGGKWRAAVSDLQRALAGPGLSAEAAAAASQHLTELQARMPQL